MFFDGIGYLHDDILCKVDRAAMACSLETRAPFLDHNVVANAWKMPLDMKIKGGVGKIPLRTVLNERVPKGLLDRPKAGFALPVNQWLRGPLREWAESLLNRSSIQSSGYLNEKLVEEVWRSHLTQERDNTALLWRILMLQAWLKSETSGAVAS